jgi:DNA-binding transcriptional regulator YiaG
MSIEETVAVAEARVRVARGDLAEIRSRARLSQSAIARAVGVSRPTVLRWEAGERRPSGLAAVRLAYLLRELDHTVREPRRRT